MNTLWRWAAPAIISLALATPQIAEAQCTSPTRISGTWKADDGGTYSVRRAHDNVIWWIGRSGDGGRTFTNVFRGERTGNTIRGEWADIGANNWGTLTLEMNVTKSGDQEHISGFRKTGSTGSGFGATSWGMGCRDQG